LAPAISNHVFKEVNHTIAVRQVSYFYSKTIVFDILIASAHFHPSLLRTMESKSPGCENRND
jgi:hypothetical protein